MGVKKRVAVSAGDKSKADGQSQEAPSSLPPKSKQKFPKKRDSKNGVAASLGYGYIFLVVVLAAVSGILHWNHVFTIFENDRRFSHLSELERELSFRTEMGFYYSYYKTIAEAPSFLSGVNAIVYDNVTEYPSTINTLKRFNLYPEVILGGLYRIFTYVTTTWKINTMSCWNVNRGEGLSPVMSCEGIGVMSYFYVENVFALAGVMMFIFFLFGTYLSESIFGGLLAVISYFYNHSEATRIMWTPPLRESFAFPFIQLQMMLVTYVLRKHKPTVKDSILISIITMCALVPWQFSQFILMTQTAAVFATYVLQFIDAEKMKVIVKGHIIGFLLSFLLLFGNEMLLTSFYFPTLLTVYAIVSFESYICRVNIRIVIWAIQGILWIVGTVLVKVTLGKVLAVSDDAHIFDILRTKFTDYKDFHTMLYVCSAEFDFLQMETYQKITKTLLLPSVSVAVICIVFQLLKREYIAWKTSMAKEESSQNGGSVTSDHPKEDGDKLETKVTRQDGELVYHIFQLLGFTVMAVLIMRLKLLWTPHLCLLTSLLASKQFFGFGGDRWKHYSIIVLLIGLMSVQGYANLQHQWSIMGEYSNYPMEEAMEWINANAPKNAVFAGPMPTMATVKLTTGRPIVNHPHYEDAGLRQRTLLVYTIYSRKPVEEVHQNYINLHVDYVIMERHWCDGRPKAGCGMADLYDITDVENRENQVICRKIVANPERYTKFFHILMKNNGIVIFKVVK